MSAAVTRFRNIGWTALIFGVAILLYPLSLQVGAEHRRLVQVDEGIVQAKKDIRYLEAELRARASLQQLERLNRLNFGYEAPLPDQYLGDENALASLGPGGVRPARAIWVEPETGGEALAGVIRHGEAAGALEGEGGVKTARKEGADPLGDLIEDIVPEEGGEAAAKKAPKKAKEPSARAVRLASMESKLLSDAALDDFRLRAAVEQAQ